jgi:hypothetical protein
MGIESFITGKCVQTAVYWGDPVNDGYGSYTFGSDYPIEIACRWEEAEQLRSLQYVGEGSEYLLSRAVAFVTQDLEEGGYLYFGTLSELSDEQKDNPKLIEKAWFLKVLSEVFYPRSVMLK